MADELKQVLLALLGEAAAREDALLARCDDAPAERPDEWTVRDHVAHLSAWRNLCARVLENTHAGTADPPPRNSDDINDVIYQENEGLPAAIVRERAIRSRRRLVDAVAMCTPEELARPRGEGARSYERWLNVPGNGHQHVAEHLIYSLGKDAGLGDAEEIAVWSHRLDRRLEQFEAFRGCPDFNLAIFYAEHGRGERALELLRTAIAASGGLRARAEGEAALRTLLARL